MATQKTWTAYDIKMNRLRLYQDSDGILHALQGYSFLDSEGNVIDVLPSRSIGTSVVWEDVPQNVRDGLTAVNDYMYNMALNQEGMNDQA